jgi:phosphoribosylformylglycinamidine synthase
MKTPRTLIFSGYGLNCEEETKTAFELAGAEADIVHINDLIAKPKLLEQYQIAAIPGGFSYGDDTGAGKAYGSRMRQHLGEELEEFLSRDTLMIAICNGFQIATSAGILPGALVTNDSGRYSCRWVDMEVKGYSPWLKGITKISLPIAHGEGKYVAPKETLDALKKNDAVALKYVSGEISEHFDLPANPNGATQDIAGVTARSGRILGLMPHPERGVRFTSMPHWTYLKEQYLRKGKKLPHDGPGVQIFKNAVEYFK